MQQEEMQREPREARKVRNHRILDCLTWLSAGSPFLHTLVSNTASSLLLPHAESLTFSPMDKRRNTIFRT